jgi:hypothetical protein
VHRVHTCVRVGAVTIKRPSRDMASTTAEFQGRFIVSETAFFVTLPVAASW